jgi:hypothetical protein
MDKGVVTENIVPVVFRCRTCLISFSVLANMKNIRT